VRSDDLPAAFRLLGAVVCARALACALACARRQRAGAAVEKKIADARPKLALYDHTPILDKSSVTTMNIQPNSLISLAASAATRTHTRPPEGRRTTRGTRAKHAEPSQVARQSHLSELAERQSRKAEQDRQDKHDTEREAPEKPAKPAKPAKPEEPKEVVNPMNQPASQTKVRRDKRAKSAAKVDLAARTVANADAAERGEAAAVETRPVSALSASSRPARESGVSGKARHTAELQELLTVPAALASSLPVPACLRLKVPGAPVPVVFWTGNVSALKREAAPVLADIIVFDGAELQAMVCAAEADRLWHADLLGLCFEKWRRPEVPVRAAELLDGANPDAHGSWTLGRVFARLGVEVESIALDEEPLARPLHAAA
jgi:hypothetical protein